MTPKSKKADPRGQFSTASRVFEQIGVRGGRSRAARAVVNAARAVIRGYEGSAATLVHIESNGEARILELLGPELEVVFDVGANVGDWTDFALRAGARHVHAFEISPPTAAQLVARYAGEDRVVVNSFGLGAAEGTIRLRHFPDLPVLTTATDFPWDLPSEEIEAPVKTGDAYVSDHGVDRIDLLKLDVEGAEGEVLQGLRSTLERGVVGAIQFEYGRFVVLTKYMLRDFFTDLTSWGFVTGKILPNDWEPKPFDLSMENLRDANYLAVHESRPDLLKLLER